MHSLGVIRTLSYYFTKRFMQDKVALFFTFVFPLIFLFVFGGLFNSNDGPSFNIALINRSESGFAKQFVAEGKKGKVLKFEETSNFERAKEQLGRGEIDAIMELPSDFGELDIQGRPSGKLITYYDESDQQLAQAMTAVMQSVVDGINSQFIKVDEPFKLENRTLDTANLDQFDYLFAGLLGFAILSLGIFGMASGFASDKKIGAYRRMRVAPIRAWHVIVATGVTYTLVGVATVLVMFAVASAVFDFQLRGNFLNFILVSALGVVCMYGFGITVAGWARNENQAAPIANLVAFPMMFLSGSFFPRFLMPEWLQNVTTYLPLTPVIDGLRRVTTENASLVDVGSQLLIIAVWTVVIYLAAFRLFRWE